MDVVLLVARVLLAAVFAVAGVAKLADLPGSRRATRAFGVPAGLANVVGTALPLVEIAIAVALLPLATARWGAIAALALLLAFIAAMANQVRLGQHPDCHCFGQIHSEPVGAASIARNAVLAVVAAAIAWFGWDNPGTSAVAWANDGSAATIVALAVAVVGLAVLAVVAWLLVHLLGQNVRLIDRLDAIEAALDEKEIAVAAAQEPEAPAAGLPVGSPAPDFTLRGLFGETTTLAALRAAGRPTLLVFTDPNCGPCNGLMPDIGRWQREHASALTVALIGRGGVEANRPKAAEHGIGTVLLQVDNEVANAYLAAGTPAAVIVGPDGTIGSPLALGADDVRRLAGVAIGRGSIDSARPADSGLADPVVAPVRAEPAQPAAAQPEAQDAPARAGVGQPAPAIDMRDLRGRPVRLSSFRGKPTVLLFWNLLSPLCEDMLADLRELDAAPPEGAPRLVVVSSGPPAGARAMRLRARIVNDPDGRVTEAFRAVGTPAAVLLDADTNVASPITYGAQFILALAKGLDPDNPPADGVERVGRAAPAVKLTDLDGAPVRLADFRGRSTLVVQWDTGCGFCQRMQEDLKDLDANPRGGSPQLMVIARGDLDAIKALGLRSKVTFDKDNRGMRAFRAYATPSAVLVDANGNIASPIAVGANEVLALARATTPDETAAAVAGIGAQTNRAESAGPAVRVGDPAPPVALSDLDGKLVTLDSFRGQPTALVFWNPDCGFCQRMLDDLKEVEADPEEDAPRLLVVSTGSVARNREQGLRSTVVLDQTFAVGSAYGATGTPSAVLIDENGNVASDVAVGAPGVLAIANGEDVEFEAERDDPIIGLKIGADVPSLTLPDLDGRPVDLASFRGNRTMVLFWDPGCGFCQAFLPEVKQWLESPPPAAPRLVVISSGSAEQNRELGLVSTVLLDDDDLANKAFRVWSTPTGVLIDAEGRIASLPAEGGPAVLAVASDEDPVEATRRATEAEPLPSLPIGDPAPDFTLPSLDGESVSLRSFRGTPTAVAFWNPNCGFCQRMLDDLLEWEQNRPEHAPRLLVTSSGGEAANRALGFSSPVLIDEGYVAMSAFRVSGTPSVVLIDADGKVASDVVSGADDIFAQLDAATASAANGNARGRRGIRLAIGGSRRG